jgi:hypothetical protein
VFPCPFRGLLCPPCLRLGVEILRQSGYCTPVVGENLLLFATHGSTFQALVGLRGNGVARNQSNLLLSQALLLLAAKSPKNSMVFG